MISVIQLGTIDYATSLRLQAHLVGLRKDGRIGDVLLLLEHEPVITLGRNAKAANVIASPELLAQRGVEVSESDRGGDVTFHGPGQIVGYPIFDLRGFPSSGDKRPTMGVIEYVRNLEEVLIRTCADYGIPTKRVSGLTGVWATDTHVETATLGGPGESQTRDDVVLSKDGVELRLAGQPRAADPTQVLPTIALSSRAEPRDLVLAGAEEAKIAALGIHISRGVTSHGFALNVNTDLGFFDLIIPCGITNKPVTSIERELGRKVELNAVSESLSRNFGKVFSSQMLWVETLDDLLGIKVGVPMQVPEELRQMNNHEDDTALA